MDAEPKVTRRSRTEFKNGKWVVTTTITESRWVDGSKPSITSELQKNIRKEVESFDKHPGSQGKEKRVVRDG